MSSTRAVYAYDPVSTVSPPTAFVVPTYQDVFNESYYTIRGTISGTYTRYVWQYLDEDEQIWHDSSINTLEFSRGYSENVIGNYRSHRLKVFYLDSENQETYILSNTVTIFLYTTSGSSNLIKFENFATILLYNFFGLMGTILTYCVEHPIIFIGLIMSLVISAIGFLRSLIGGRYEEKKENSSD